MPNKVVEKLNSPTKVKNILEQKKIIFFNQT